MQDQNQMMPTFALLKLIRITNPWYFIVAFFCLTFGKATAQNDTENQFSNEFQYNTTIGKKSSIEIDFGQGFTSGTIETNPFYKNSQLYLRGWLHYYSSKKWKVSGFAGYYFNRDVPEIAQNRVPEVRFALQGIYYFLKGDHTMTNRVRLENRLFLKDSLEIVFRLRNAIKYVFPIAKSKSGNGYSYGIVSEEVFFKTSGNVTGKQFFDRNRISLGFGYSFSDNIQLELVYQNEYLPRKNVDQMFNVISTTIVFNDLISMLRKRNGSLPKY